MQKKNKYLSQLIAKKFKNKQRKRGKYNPRSIVLRKAKKKSIKVPDDIYNWKQYDSMEEGERIKWRKWKHLIKNSNDHPATNCEIDKIAHKSKKQRQCKHNMTEQISEIMQLIDECWVCGYYNYPNGCLCRSYSPYPRTWSEGRRCGGCGSYYLNCLCDDPQIKFTTQIFEATQSNEYHWKCGPLIPKNRFLSQQIAKKFKNKHRRQNTSHP